MNGLTLVFGLGLIIAGAFYAWLHTKSGKKWLEDLDK